VKIDDAVMGVGGRRGATPQDIRRALRIYFVADLLLIALVGLLALFLLA
jgi:adenosylcobinamide-phosphate synthase